MDVKPVVKPLGGLNVTPVKPVAVAQVAKPISVAPVVTPKTVSTVSVDTTAKDIEVKSVTEIPKEERLGDIKQAVNKVEASQVETETKPETKSKKKGKLVDNLKSSSKVSEVNSGEVIKKDSTTKDFGNGVVINFLDYKKEEDAFAERIKQISDKNVLLEGITTDEMKCIEVLWSEGKSVVDRKLGEYVLSYDVYEDTLNKIFVDEIIEVVINKYYDDVTLANPKYMGCYYHVYHKGRRVFDKINKRTYDYLSGKGLIPKEYVCTIDVNTRLRFFNKNVEQVNQEDFDRELKNKLRAANRFDQAYLNLDIEQLEN